MKPWYGLPVVLTVAVMAAHALAATVTSQSVKVDYREEPATAYYAAFCERDTLTRIAEAPGGREQIPNYVMIDRAAKDYEKAVREFIGTQLDASLQEKIRESAEWFQVDYLKALKHASDADGTAGAQDIFNDCVALAEKYGDPIDREWMGGQSAAPLTPPSAPASPAAPAAMDATTKLRIENLRELIANYEYRLARAPSEEKRREYQAEIEALTATLREVEAGAGQ